VVGKNLRPKDRGTAGFLAGLFLTMALGSGIVFASRVGAQTTVIPSVSLSERYDSNVFRSTRSAVPSGAQPWDFVTTAGVIVDVVNKSRLADSLLRAGLNGNAYVYNSDLAFVSTNVFAASDMTRGVSELVRGLQLRITDSFRFTPEMPAFLDYGGHPDDTADIYSGGVQGSRGNTYRNILSANSDYTLSRSFSLTTNYSYSIFRRGRTDTTSEGVDAFMYIDNTQHSVDIGPTYTFDGGDTLFFKYNYSTGESVPEGSGVITGYTFQTIAPVYVTKAVPGWTLTMSGGPTLVEQEAENHVFLSGKLGFATDYDRRTHVAMWVSREARPSYYQTSSSLVGNLARFNVSYSVTPLVRLTAGVNYGYNETVPVKTSAFRTAGGAVALDYRLTQSTKLVLSQEYTYYERTGVLPYDRIATMLTLKTEWK
jgi:hypothetical protein